ncbi:hypothetical protein V6N12_020956 [Hibiscus sabdariffa]|uniref:Uncharacterized protein n=1 Tax=Hibiscus sabdariffa TaxID=183260 RepID=A0ABR2D0A5_9ROSI
MAMANGTGAGPPKPPRSPRGEFLQSLGTWTPRLRKDLKNFSKEASTTASTISSSTFCGVESVASFSDPFFELLSFFSIATAKAAKGY